MSETKSVYLDNAATSYPKPQSVFEAMREYMQEAGNPGRGAHRHAMFGARKILDARLNISKFLGIEADERLIFTPGCTHGLNYVLKGLDWKSGDRVVLSGLEHNSVSRPLEQLKEKLGIEVSPLCLESCDQSFLSSLEKSLRDKPAKLCVFTHASNVTGQILPLLEAVKIAKKHGAMTLVDAAQVAGKISLSLSSSQIDFWVSSGHKGLLGPAGVGLLYVAPGMELESLVSGGTGSVSESFELPEFLPDRLEAGTLAGPNIVGLSAGIDILSGKNLEEELSRQLKMVDKLESWASSREELTIFGPTFKDKNRSKMPVVAIAINGMSPGELSSTLNDSFNIAVRPGLHCAALMHKGLGTLETGLTRVSFGSSNSEEDVVVLIQALEKVANSLRKSLKKSV